MKTRRRTPQSSLELLLDTICNAFGGIVFLAMLVALLLRMTVPRASQAKTPEAQPQTASATTWQSHLADLQAELAETTAAIERQRDVVRRYGSADIQAQLDDLHELQAQVASLATQREALESQVAAADAQAQAAQAGLADLDAQLVAAQQMVEALAADLEAERAARTETASLPRERSTSKTEVGLVVRFRRLYVWHDYGSDGERLGLNTDEFVVVGEEDGAFVTLPRLDRGVPLDQPDCAAAVRARLRRFSPHSKYLALVVFPDSFGVFHDLKRALVEAKYEYRLMPVTPGEEIVDRGGRGGRVQ